MSKRAWNKTCGECGEVFTAAGPRQRECDECWGAAMGAVRVEYRPVNGGRGNARHAIIVCSRCTGEYATTQHGKQPGLCGSCRHGTCIKTCDDCHEEYVARGKTQKQCDDCWGKMMGAERVEYRSVANGRRLARTAIFICRECNQEFATTITSKKSSDLCTACVRQERTETCGTCRSDFVANGPKQKQCDNCLVDDLRARGFDVLGVALVDRSGGIRVRAVTFRCSECGDVKTSRANGLASSKSHGLCGPCYMRTYERNSETREKMSASASKRCEDPEQRKALAARGRKIHDDAEARAAWLEKCRDPETRVKVSQEKKKHWQDPAYRAQKADRDFGFIYLVAGGGEVKVGASLHADSLQQRLSAHAKPHKGWDTPLAIWEVDPSAGAELEIACIIAMGERWDCVTTWRKEDGNEAFYTNDWDAAVELVNEVVGAFGVMTDLRDPDVTWAVAA